MGDLSSEEERRVHAPVGIDRALKGFERNGAPGGCVRNDDDRRERRVVDPLARDDRLPVVVKIERRGSPRIGDLPLGEHQRGAGGRDDLRCEMTLREHRDERFGIALNVRFFGRDVRHREEVEQLAENLPFMLRAPGAHARRIVDGRCTEQSDQRAVPQAEPTLAARSRCQPWPAALRSGRFPRPSCLTPPSFGPESTGPGISARCDCARRGFARTRASRRCG